MTTRQTTSANSEAFRILAWLGVGLQVAALVFVIVSQRWGGVLSIAIFLVLSLGFLLMKEQVPALISLLVVVVAITNASGWAWEWYALVWFDEFVHVFSSLTVVAALLSVAWERTWLELSTGGRLVLRAAAIGLGLGIIWELTVAIFASLDWIDTLSDLVMDVMGAIAGGWIAAWAVQQQHRYQRA